MLVDALESKDKARLLKVLEVCEREGFITQQVRACREMLEKIDDAEGAMEMATREMSEEFLSRALEMCDEFGYNSASVQACRMLVGSFSVALRLFICMRFVVEKDAQNKSMRTSPPPKRRHFGGILISVGVRLFGSEQQASCATTSVRQRAGSRRRSSQSSRSSYS